MQQTPGRGAQVPVHVENLTRGEILATAVRVADNFWTRLRGLMGSAPLAPGGGLLIAPCKSVHTHFMRFPIDVVYLSEAHEVVGIDEHLAPWQFGRFYRGVRFVLELRPGSARATRTQVGDQLRVRGYQP